MPRRGAGGRAPHAPMRQSPRCGHIDCSRSCHKPTRATPRHPPTAAASRSRAAQNNTVTPLRMPTRGHMSRSRATSRQGWHATRVEGTAAQPGPPSAPPDDVFSHGPTRRGRWQSRQPAGSREQRERATWAGDHRAHEARGPQSPSERGSDGEVRTDTTWKRREEPVITSKPEQREKRTHKQNTRRYQGARRHWTAPRSRHAPRERERGAVRQGGPDTHHGREKRRQ